MTRLASGARLEVFDSLDSTSAEARRRADAGERGHLWLVALHQTAGYGRRARGWESARGDFAGTLLFDPQTDPKHLGQLSFVAALGVAEALPPIVGAGGLALKWPNDILFKGKKLAGLLLERVDDGAGPLIALGIGVNVVTAPASAPYPTARLADVAASRDLPEPPALAAAIDAAFARRLGEFQREGFAPIREAWLARAHGIGEPIAARLPRETLEGRFDGLDETGALIVKTREGARAIAAGDVFFGGPAARG